MEHFQPIEDVPVLNVHKLHRAGALMLGTVTHWQWPGLVATVRAETTRILISTGGRETWVQILREPGTRGNDYPIFECPGCGTRRYNLHLTDVVGCRACLRLDYACNHEHRLQGLRRAVNLRPGASVPSPACWRRYHRGHAVGRVARSGPTTGWWLGCNQPRPKS
jgi:hypothetical protein